MAGYNSGRWMAGSNSGGWMAASNSGGWMAGSNSGGLMAGSNSGGWMAGSNSGRWMAGSNSGGWMAGSNSMARARTRAKARFSAFPVHTLLTLYLPWVGYLQHIRLHNHVPKMADNLVHACTCNSTTLCKCGNVTRTD